LALRASRPAPSGSSIDQFTVNANLPEANGTPLQAGSTLAVHVSRRFTGKLVTPDIRNRLTVDAASQRFLDAQVVAMRQPDTRPPTRGNL